MTEHLLVDARNSMYRAVFAGLSDPAGEDHVLIFFRFLNSWVRRFRPRHVHLFWDTPKDGLWRRKILPTYKCGRNAHSRYDREQVTELLQRCSEACLSLAQHMNCLNYVRAGQEADDLVYAFCRQRGRDEAVIVSSDSDFRQLEFNLRGVQVYNPMQKGRLACVDLDPVEVKSFVGEKADNIPGYDGIGPKRAAKIIADYAHRLEFFDLRGDGTYRRNRALIDLSMCPYVLENVSYVSRVRARRPVFDGDAIRAFATRYRIRGLLAEYGRTFQTFKTIGAAAAQR